MTQISYAASILDNAGNPPCGMTISQNGIRLASLYRTSGKKDEGIVRLDDLALHLKDLTRLVNACRTVLNFMNTVDPIRWREKKGSIFDAAISH